VDDVEPVVPHFPPQKPHEVAVRFQDDQNCIRSHTPKDFGGKGAHPWPVFQEDAGAGPVHLLEEVIDQEA